MRYRKEDRTFTEDHFLCSDTLRGLQIDRFYRGRLEKVFPEYRGTHKLQIDVAATTSTLSPMRYPTSVNTISVTRGFKS